ncbi:TPA: ferredoxin [Clostridioides difficile]|nr:ferredoxin [Clostridioides difficile]
MKANVNQDTCIGCGLCPSICQEVFDMKDDGKSHVIVDEVPSDAEESAAEARESCPVDAIDVH